MLLRLGRYLGIMPLSHAAIWCCCVDLLVRGVDIGAEEWRQTQLWTQSIDTLLGQCKPRLEALFRKMAGCLETGTRKGERRHRRILTSATTTAVFPRRPGMGRLAPRAVISFLCGVFFVGGQVGLSILE